MPQTIKVQMTHTKETSGTHRYDAADRDAPMRDVYIKKSAFNGSSAPRSITVTIEPD